MTADAIMRHNAFRREKAIFPRASRRINFSDMTCGGDEHTIIIPAPVSISIGGRVGGAIPAIISRSNHSAHKNITVKNEISEVI